MDALSTHPDPGSIHRAFWNSFVTLGGKRFARRICETIDERAMHNDPPLIRSDDGTLLLRPRLHGQLADIAREPWRLSCRTVLSDHTPILELDLCSSACEEALRREPNSLRIAIRAFRSLAPKLAGRSEVAIVSRSTMHYQLAYFSFEHRPMRRTPHWYGDSMLRHFYLLAFDPIGKKRAVHYPVFPLVESAVSLKRFLGRYK